MAAEVHVTACAEPWRSLPWKANTMKNNVLQPHSIPEVAENRAQSCQPSGHSPASNAGIGAQDRKTSPRRRMTSGLGCGLVFVFFLGLPGALSAQKQQGQWSDLRGLRVGQGIVVIEASMKHHDGGFISLTDEAVTLQEKGSNISVKREAVVRVSTASGARRGEHAVIGLVVGGLAGAGIGAAAGSGAKGFVGVREGIGALIGVVVGATSGAIVGAVIPAHTTIYRAAPVAAAH
jgi:hypothetical protein